MKSAIIMAMCLAASACHSPHLADPQFIFPDAPAELMKSPQGLVPLGQPVVVKSIKR